MIVVNPEHEPIGFWLGTFGEALSCGFEPVEVFLCVSTDVVIRPRGPVRFTALLTSATADCLESSPLFRRCAVEPIESTIARVWGD